MEEVGGRQKVWVNPSARVLIDGGGWWQAEDVGDKRYPLHPRFE
jgi:hypothetical protein